MPAERTTALQQLQNEHAALLEAHARMAAELNAAVRGDAGRTHPQAELSASSDEAAASSARFASGAGSAGPQQQSVVGWSTHAAGEAALGSISSSSYDGSRAHARRGALADENYAPTHGRGMRRGGRDNVGSGGGTAACSSGSPARDGAQMTSDDLSMDVGGEGGFGAEDRGDGDGGGRGRDVGGGGGRGIGGSSGGGGGGGGGSVKPSVGLPPEVSAELMRLRRKLSDLTADNSLLTQNFLMVQSRYKEVCGARDDERKGHEATLKRAREEADEDLAKLRGVHTALLRSELRLLDGTLERSRAAAAAASLHVVLRSRLRLRLSWVMARWLAGTGYVAHLQMERLAASKAASQSAAVALRGARNADALRHLIRIEEGRRRAEVLSHACRRWRLVMAVEALAAVTAELDAARETRTAVMAEAAKELEQRQQMLSAEKAHSEALSKEMSQLAEHAREMEKAAQQQQMAAMEATREKDAIAAKAAQSELQAAVVQSQLDAAAEERKRAEATRETLQRERDEYLRDLRKAESEAKLISATSEDKSINAQQNSARLIAVVTELRRRLAAVESAREKERKQLSQFQASCLQLQGQVQQQRLQQAELLQQEQRRDISTAQLAQARMDADAQLAFNAELLAFASKHDLDLQVPSTTRTTGGGSRATSPLARAQALVAATPTSSLRARRL